MWEKKQNVKKLETKSEIVTKRDVIYARFARHYLIILIKGKIHWIL